MGIQSLTSYLEYRSKQYFENYELHDCNLIIDGSGLCFNLYNWEYDFWETGYSYECYGGDYDKYAEIVKGFFGLLEMCKVKPYIIFGGRNGIDRVSVIETRLKDKLMETTKVTPNVIRNNIRTDRDQRNGRTYTRVPEPVALKYAFRDVLHELNLKRFTCEEDPNREMACLAKHLNCPVLSANSDFFVLGSLFIPLSSLQCQVRVSSRRCHFIACKIYKIDKLLHALNKRPNNNFIPYLLPVLLGSNYIKPEVTEPFLKKLKIEGRRQQKVDGIFNWIKQQHTFEAALKTILDNFHNHGEKNNISKQINHTIVGYSSVSITSLLEYFDIKVKNKGPLSPREKMRGLEEGLDSEKRNFGKKDESESDLFMKRLIECRYPSFFIDMLKENRYFLLTNIEDFSRKDANSIGYTIMATIHNILVQHEEKQLTVFRRTSDMKLEEYILPACTDQMPSIEEIDYLSVERRLDILLHVLDIEPDISKNLQGISNELQLFLLSLKYTTAKTALDAPFIYSLVLCFIILNYVDPKLTRFYRTVHCIQSIREENQNDDSLDSKKYVEDSIICMQKYVKYFEMDSGENDKTYDREIMHSIAEFQCVFLHLKFLNNLLDFPLHDAAIYKIFDNTFIYNMTRSLRNKASLKNYLSNFLDDCSSIHCELFKVLQLLEEHAIL